MRRTIAVLLATGLVAAAGCGDDDENEELGTTQSNTGAVTPPSTDPDEGGAGSGGTSGGTRVVLTEFEIDPANPKAEPGVVTFEVRNEGSAPHALEIEGGGEEFETEVLQGGDTAELQATLEAGEYKWYCPVGNHAEQGMAGTLTVGDGKSEGASSSSGGGSGY
ncbi:MAG: cupredoxin domain-containing protein [Actinomycetota bacterium]|nr:cupredoxin domain-containing protein [Actinomycetota bacterium]